MRWNNEGISTRRVDPPKIEEGETIIFDEPGRCGGIDSHCHHYQLVKSNCGTISLLVRHGAGRGDCMDSRTKMRHTTCPDTSIDMFCILLPSVL